MNWFKSTMRGLKFKPEFKMKVLCGWVGQNCLIKSKGERRLVKVLEAGSDKVEKMLDLRTIVKH